MLSVRNLLQKHKHKSFHLERLGDEFNIIFEFLALDEVLSLRRVATDVKCFIDHFWVSRVMVLNPALLDEIRRHIHTAEPSFEPVLSDEQIIGSFVYSGVPETERNTDNLRREEGGFHMYSVSFDNDKSALRAHIDQHYMVAIYRRSVRSLRWLQWITPAEATKFRANLCPRRRNELGLRVTVPNLDIIIRLNAATLEYIEVRGIMNPTSFDEWLNAPSITFPELRVLVYAAEGLTRGAIQRKDWGIPKCPKLVAAEISADFTLYWRSCLYDLCTRLYSFINGKKPYPGDQNVGESWGERLAFVAPHSCKSGLVWSHRPSLARRTFTLNTRLWRLFAGMDPKAPRKEEFYDPRPSMTFLLGNYGIVTCRSLKLILPQLLGPHLLKLRILWGSSALVLLLCVHSVLSEQKHSRSPLLRVEIDELVISEVPQDLLSSICLVEHLIPLLWRCCGRHAVASMTLTLHPVPPTESAVVLGRNMSNGSLGADIEDAITGILTHLLDVDENEAFQLLSAWRIRYEVQLFSGSLRLPKLLSHLTTPKFRNLSKFKSIYLDISCLANPQQYDFFERLSKLPNLVVLDGLKCIND